MKKVLIMLAVISSLYACAQKPKAGIKSKMNFEVMDGQSIAVLYSKPHLNYDDSLPPKTFLFGDSTMYFDINVSCGFSLPYSIKNDTMYLFWNMALDCEDDYKHVIKKYGSATIPQTGIVFAKIYAQGDSAFKVEYLTKSWVESVNREYDLMFPDQLFVISEIEQKEYRQKLKSLLGY